MSGTNPDKFNFLVQTLLLILDIPLGLDPSNLILIKDAALKCLCCVCIDAHQFLANFNFEKLVEFTKLKRSAFT